MGYDGFGNFTRSYNWVNDKNALIKITAARMDGEFDNYATGMNAVMLRNGVAAMTGDLKLGNNAISGIKSGLVGAPSISFSVDATSGMWLRAAGEVAVSAGGVEKIRYNAFGACLPAGNAFGVGTTTPRTSVDIVGLTSLQGVFEDTVVTAVALNGALNVDVLTRVVWVYDSNAAANFSFNIRGSGGFTLDSLMAAGQSVTIAIEVPQGNPAYYCTAITVDGAAPAQLKWFNGGAPVAGNVNGIDVYAITVIKKSAGPAVWYVRASQSQVL